MMNEKSQALFLQCQVLALHYCSFHWVLGEDQDFLVDMHFAIKWGFVCYYTGQDRIYIEVFQMCCYSLFFDISRYIFSSRTTENWQTAILHLSFCFQYFFMDHKCSESNNQGCSLCIILNLGFIMMHIGNLKWNECRCQQITCIAGFIQYITHIIALHHWSFSSECTNLIVFGLHALLLLLHIRHSANWQQWTIILFNS